MFVSDFNAEWLEHPFLRNQKLIRSDEEVVRTAACGIDSVYIDTQRGLDADDMPTAEEAAQELEETLVGVFAGDTNSTPSFADSVTEARQVIGSARRALRELLSSVRLGRSIDFPAATETARQLALGAARHPHACLLLGRLNRSDDYTFRHSVNVALILGIFSRSQQLPEDTVQALALGGILHDVGKMAVPVGILNKPSMLDAGEMQAMREHVSSGVRLVSAPEGALEAAAFDVIAEHHERCDGTGYPHGLKGDAISLGGRMGGIIDVYDALTSDRVYRRAINPAESIRKMFEWAERHFDRNLTHAFIKTVGIYPAGSLLRLESGRIGVVLRQGEQSLMAPVVRVIYDTHRMAFVTPVDVELAKTADRVVSHEAPEKWNIPLERFID